MGDQTETTTPEPTSVGSLDVVDVTETAREAGYYLRWAPSDRMISDEADAQGVTVPIRLTTRLADALGSRAKDEEAFRRSVIRALRSAHRTIHEHLVDGTMGRTLVTLQLPDRKAPGWATALPDFGEGLHGLVIGFGPGDLWKLAARDEGTDAPANGSLESGTSFHFEGADAVARAQCVIPALLVALPMGYAVPVGVAVLALATAVFCLGLRASITVASGQVVVEKSCWTVRYLRREAPALQDVAYSADWGSPSGALGVVVTLGGAKVRLGTRWSARRLHDELRRRMAETLGPSASKEST